ncbi:hypothetical protein VNO80_25427 [Phaseolus coccineus]|uniref:Uncharacterized protein n=1 Tax=Phaseolus coccineus TaxID=3886 RepID=A0AAN9LZG7_PHACN
MPLMNSAIECPEQPVVNEASQCSALNTYRDHVNLFLTRLKEPWHQMRDQAHGVVENSFQKYKSILSVYDKEGLMLKLIKGGGHRRHHLCKCHVVLLTI